MFEGIKLSDMCEMIEDCNRRLVKENGIQVKFDYSKHIYINYLSPPPHCH